MAGIGDIGAGVSDIFAGFGDLTKAAARLPRLKTDW
jgi:hypothetical protein